MPKQGINLHVVKADNGWIVKRENQVISVASSKTQKDAVHKATKILNASDEGGEVFIHGLDGKFRERNTINRKDPCPPKG